PQNIAKPKTEYTMRTEAQSYEARDDRDAKKRDLVAPHLAARALGHWRSGRSGLHVRGFSRRRRAAALASHAAWANRLRRLALPGLLGLRWQPAADQPGSA